MIQVYLTNGELERLMEVEDTDLNEVLQHVRKIDNRFFLREINYIQRRFFKKDIIIKRYELYHDGDSGVELISFDIEGIYNKFVTAVDKAYILNYFWGFIK